MSLYQYHVMKCLPYLIIEAIDTSIFIFGGNILTVFFKKPQKVRFKDKIYAGAFLLFYKHFHHITK